LRIGYIVKHYPYHSISSIANEIIAHGNANIKIDVFSLASNPENPRYKKQSLSAGQTLTIFR